MMMVQWNLCPSCNKVVDEFERECGWCFPKRKYSDKQLLLFGDEANFRDQDSVNVADAQKVRDSTLKKEKNV